MSGGDDAGATGMGRWAEALTWYATLRQAHERELTSAIGRKWEEWYADAENRRIFDDVSRLAGDRGRYRKRRRCRKSELAEDPYDLSVPIAQWRAGPARPQRRIRRPACAIRWGWLLSGGIGLAAMALLFVFLPVWLGSTGGSPRPVVYQTGVGGIEDVHLADGSSIILGGLTKISVLISAQRRSVTLAEGQAWFKVKDDPQWPFVVDVGEERIKDLGTAFLVTRESDRVVVTVTQGAVEVFAPTRRWRKPRLVKGHASRTSLAPIRVARGQELAVSDNGTLLPVEPANTRAATAWTHGQLTFDDQPLRYVVETVNRYSSRHIVISPSAAALRFSGIIYDDDIEDWLKSLQVILPVAETKRGASVYIRMREPTSVSLRVTTNPHR